MRAAFCPAASVIELRGVAEPQPGADEVSVRVLACGICGSDLHWFHGQFPPPAVCPGHEIAGVVAACGRGVTGVRAGDRVAVEPMVVCRQCHYCCSGRPQLCPKLRIIGVHEPGGFAEFVRVPAYSLVPLPKGLDDALGALTEPTAVAVHAVRISGVGRGDRVLVLGAGTIGLLSVLAAHAAGAAEILVSARHAHQAEMARRLRATVVFAANDEGDRERDAYVADHPIDVAIETVGGTANTIGDAVELVRPAGTVVMLGVFTASPPLPALRLMNKEVRLVGAMMYDRTGPRSGFEIAADLLTRERDTIAGIVTHRMPLDAIQSAFETAADKRRGVIKVLVQP